LDSQAVQVVLLAAALLQQADLSLLSQVAQSFFEGQVHDAKASVALATTKVMMRFMIQLGKERG
jgi:hypothetical protein